MKITILDNYKSKKYLPEKKSILIRIGDTFEEDDMPIIEHNLYHEIHLFQFYDIKPKPCMPINWNAFSEKDGERMLDIFKNIKENNYDEFVVHCHAGISRSPAIAIALCWYLKEEEKIQSILKNSCPNTHVLNLMAKLMNIYNEKKDFIDNLEIIDDDDLEIIF